MNRPASHRQELYARVLNIINAACTSAGLTQTETVIIAAQFVGMSIAKGPPVAQDAQAEVATKAMLDARTTALIRAGMVVTGDPR